MIVFSLPTACLLIGFCHRHLSVATAINNLSIIELQLLDRTVSSHILT